MKNILKSIYFSTVPPTIDRKLKEYRKRKLAQKEWKFIKKYRQTIVAKEKILQNKEKITILFFTMNLAMWKYDRLFYCLQKHPRFNPIIIISPYIKDTLADKIREIKLLENYFSQQKFEYIVAYNREKNSWSDIKKNVNPDIVFYTQPSSSWLIKNYRIAAFSDALFCYTPYTFSIIDCKWQYDYLLHNIAWKFFVASNDDVRYAKKHSRVKGINCVVSGYPLADFYLDKHRVFYDPWKIKNRKIKRIIWAPHHSIQENSLIKLSTFLLFSDIMLEIAEQYRNEIQITFKPHPVLKERLNVHSDWGVEKTNKYYRQWENLENGQVEIGDYIDLFQTSDGLIHDSASFMVEYHYTLKPSLFLVNYSPEKQISTFGVKALSIHYQGSVRKDIEQFIEKVILKQEDTKIEERKLFLQQYLLPPNNKSVAENMMSEITKSLKIG